VEGLLAKAAPRGVSSKPDYPEGRMDEISMERGRQYLGFRCQTRHCLHEMAYAEDTEEGRKQIAELFRDDEFILQCPKCKEVYAYARAVTLKKPRRPK
jgi:hypothetical protein